MASIVPERLSPQSKFKFKCHKGVSCFTECCRGTNIILTPYDIIRLKNRLDISSEEFLTLYTTPQLLEKTDLPVVTIRLLEDQNDACPFVRKEGCIIYSDRPTACRYYPVGVASLSHKEGADEGGFYFFVNEPHCKGFEEQDEWNIEDWRKDQSVDLYDEINADWTDLVVRKRSFPANLKLTDQSKQMFFQASYNIDKFKQFVFQTSFLSRYEIGQETVRKIREDELELLAFGMKWLKWLFYKEGDFKLKG
jgi:Fe-S-cluster containining protein